MSPSISIEIYPANSQNISEQLVSEVSDAFRRVFNHEPYGQFLFYPSTGKAISAEKVFKLSASTYADLTTLNQFDLDSYPKRKGDQALFWTDPEVTREKLKAKLRKDSTLIIIRRQQDRQLLGMALGRTIPLHEAFETEEWQNPHYYSRLESKQYHRDANAFYQNINKALSDGSSNQQITPETEIFLWSCVFTTPEGRGQGLFPLLAQHLLDSIPSDKQNLLLLGEVMKDSKMHEICKAVEHVLVPNVFDKDALLGITQVSKLKEHFNHIH